MVDIGVRPSPRLLDASLDVWGVHTGRLLQLGKTIQVMHVRRDKQKASTAEPLPSSMEYPHSKAISEAQ